MTIQELLRPNLGKIGFIIIMFTFMAVIPFYLLLYHGEFNVKVWGFPLYIYYYDPFGESIFPTGSNFSFTGFFFDLIIWTIVSYLIIFVYEKYRSMEQNRPSYY
jgi:hypothetical protein